ncbi:hypothetical protein [Sulfurimonas sp.]|uniref:LptM family lipoprotein n=1 Tax=Sulfurimonas sp. TaxID=2022749 RepID=UPI0025E56478|nr:hypothetical protein [Sulfurimonas sp.]
MKRIISIISLLLTTFVLIGCGAAKLSPAQQELVKSNATMYTKVSMWTEKNRVYGTNYSRGLHIPINTEVKILAVSSKVITFEYMGSKINYYVYTKYTKVDAAGTLDRLFSKTKVDLSMYSEDTLQNILDGKIVVGMTKEEVVLSRGYPPFHATISLKADVWKYWNNRFQTIEVRFEDNKVI